MVEEALFEQFLEWHSRMDFPDSHTVLTPKLVESLYVEAMILTDEARAYFDVEGQRDQALLDPAGKLAFTCESLRVTTKLMQVVSWLLAQKAAQGADGGEPCRLEWVGPFHPLGADQMMAEPLPPGALSVVLATNDLYERVRRLDTQLERREPVESPARTLLGRLEASF